RARPQEARGAAPSDPADPPRSRRVRSNLGERIHSGCRPEGCRAGPHPDPLLPVLGAVRGRPAQAAMTLRRRSMVRLLARPVTAVALFFALWELGTPGRTADAAGPQGQVVYAFHVTLAPRWLDPGETEARLTAVK